MESDPIYQEAMERFGSLFETVQKTGLREPAAMTLATVDATGQPSARIVLLRDVDERGFVFFTNSQSRKCACGPLFPLGFSQGAGLCGGYCQPRERCGVRHLLAAPPAR